MTCRDAAPARPLEAIRAELDEIDDRILELVVRRAALADEVRRAKTDTGAAALRPAREAQMLRRFASHELGGLGLEQVWRLWRELIMANARLQYPFTVDTVAASRDLALWDLGRAHFCFETGMEAHGSADAALVRTIGEPGRVALLPAADEAWWRRIAAPNSGARIFAALPMVAESADAAPKAMLAADIALQPSGNDMTILHISGVTAVSGLAEAEHALRSAGFDPAYRVPGGAAALVGVRGFVDDASQAPKRLAIDRPTGIEVTVLGAHSAPVEPSREIAR